MNLQRKLATVSMVTMFAALPLMLVGFSGGPSPAVSGAPGDSTCAQSGCHVGAGNPTRGSGVELLFPGGAATYTPGVTQRLMVKITTPQSQQSNGFQLSVRPASNTTQQAGNLASVDARTLILCPTGSAKPVNGGCPAAAPVQYIEHSGSSGGAEWSFDWTPPATDVGPVTFYFAGNAANGDFSSGGDRIFLNSVTATPGASVAAPVIRAAQPVLQSFSGNERLSPGTWAEIYGTNLSTVTREWAGGDFSGNNAPTSLDGVSVLIDNKPAFVRYISPTQINVQVPDIGIGQVPIVVTNAQGNSQVIRTATAVSPALLTTPNFLVGGVQYVAALHSDNATFVGRTGLIAGVAFRPARPGDTIIIYAVGCGATTPPSPAGTIVGGALKTVPNVQVRFGQTVANAAVALSPGAIGLCQFNVTVPNVANGDQDLEATVAGVATGQGLKITVQQ